MSSANQASRAHDSSAVAQAGAVVALATCALVTWYAQGVHPVGLVIAFLHAVVWLRRRWLPVLVVIDLLLIGWMGAMLAPYGFATRYDTWMHLALVRRVAENGLFPPDAYYHGYPAAPVLSLVHQLQGGVAWITGVGFEALWRWGTPLVLVGTGGVLVFGYRELFGDLRTSLVATLFHLSWRASTWAFALYPRNLAHAAFMLSLGFLWRALGQGSARAALAAGAALGLSVAFHVVGGAIGASIVAAILALETARRRWREGSWDGLALSARVVGAAVAVASPWLVADGLAADWTQRTPT